MAVTFNGETLIITLDSGATEVDVVDDIYEPWKDWMLASPLNRKYPPALRSDGGAPLSSIINQGSYIFLNNSAGWRIKPPEEDITIYLTGNLAVENTTLPAFIPTTGDYTAAILGLQPVTQGVTEVMADQLAFASYDSVISCDPLNLTGYAISGTASPAGSKGYPCLLPNDAVAVGDAIGIKEIKFLSDATLDSGFNAAGYVLSGENKISTSLTINTGAVVDECRIESLTISGTLDNNTYLHDCVIDNLDYVEGDIHNCEIQGTLTVGGSAGLEMFSCYSGRQGPSDPAIIDCGGGGKNIAIHNWSGHINIVNQTGWGIVGIGTGSAMYVKIQDTVEAGIVHIMGCAKVVDESTGTAMVRTNYQLTPATIAAELLASTVHGSNTLQDVLTDVHDEALGKWVVDPTGKTLTLYREDGITVLKTFSLTDTTEDVNAFLARTPA